MPDINHHELIKFVGLGKPMGDGSIRTLQNFDGAKTYTYTDVEGTEWKHSVYCGTCREQHNFTGSEITLIAATEEAQQPPPSSCPAWVVRTDELEGEFLLVKGWTTGLPSKDIFGPLRNPNFDWETAMEEQRECCTKIVDTVVDGIVWGLGREADEFATVFVER